MSTATPFITGQTEVEEDELVRALQGQVEPFRPVVGRVDAEPLGLQGARDEADDPRLVVDYEDPRHPCRLRMGPVSMPQGNLPTKLRAFLAPCDISVM